MVRINCSHGSEDSSMPAVSSQRNRMGNVFCVCVNSASCEQAHDFKALRGEWTHGYICR